MKQFILVLMLVIIASTETVKPTTDQCACPKILSQADCLTVSTCSWTAAVAATATTAATPGSCGLPVTPTNPTVASAYCPQVTVPATNCWKTPGCAYVDSKCTHFTGCTAYVKTTNSDCQAISSLCITDGTQCTDAKSCNEYTTETMCTSSASISGIQKCKFENNACRDYVCTEADSTLASNTTCNAWLSGCVTTGKGCILTLGACASYVGDDVACSGLKGTDGNCEGTVGGTNCMTRVCSKAAATVVTDADCNTYQGGCITNGKGCVTSPLPGCATFLGDNTTCVGYIGSDGTCEGDTGATNCRPRVCTNASASNNTDVLCTAYKTGCVTNGKGCVTSKATCAGYSGTTTSCVGYIGTDGYCKGTNASVSAPCAAKVCTDAPTTSSTDAICISYQLGCKSTGKGCIGALGLCSGYSGTTTSCEGYIGSDGKCKGTSADVSTSCTLKICTEAPSSTTTNEACASYQTGCVTTGSGCVSLTGCLDTIKSISCTGSGCGWNSICVSSQYCQNFQTTSICNGNMAILVSGGTTTTTPCYWTGTQCRNLACTDASIVNNTDALCGTFLTGCLTNGNGCLAPSVSCTSYVGTRGTCSAFTAKCWNTEAAIATTNCTVRVCTDDITSTTDSACEAFKTGCRTQGTGCVDGTNACTTYQGIQSTCDTFKQVVGSTTTRCYNTSGASATTACTVKQCIDNTTSTTNGDCETFLSGCLTKGLGCVTPGTACSSYTGNQATCSNYKGSNGGNLCWNTISAATSANCKNKECSDALNTVITNADCESFLTGCLTDGSGCVAPSVPCTSYEGTLSECSAFTGDSKKCYNSDSCTAKACGDKLNPTNNDDCKNYLSTCRYFNGTCITNVTCANYPGTTLALCQDVLDTSNAKCWWTTGSACVSRSCSTVPNTVTNQSGCDSHVSGCVYAGNGLCAPKSTCASYTANGTLAADKLANCQAMVDTNDKPCFYSTLTNCESKTCLNVPGTITGISSCDAHVAGCRYNGVSCVGVNNCSSYAIAGSTDAQKLSRCQNMTDSDSKGCWWVTGSACQSKTCATATSIVPIAQATCDTHLSNSCAFQNSCIRQVCQLKTDATSNLDCTGKDPLCRFNGNAMCIVSQALCTSYVIDSSVTVLLTKQTICNSLTNTTGGQCSYSGTGQTCKVRACSDKIDATADQAACTAWMTTCRFTGKTDATGGCQDATSNCVYALTLTSSTAAVVCLTLKDSTGNFCMGGSGTNCVARTCAGKTDATADQAACTAWMTTCRFTGKTDATGGCQDATSNCVYALTLTSSTAAVVCLTLKDSTDNFCMGGSGTNCVARTCAGKTDATADQDACTAWMTTCRFTGKTDATGGCQDATSNCVYALTLTSSTAAVVCLTLKDSTGNFCMSGSGTNCVARTCAGKTDATADQAACTAWMTTCRFTGKTDATGGCQDATSNCVYALTLTSSTAAVVCLTLKDSTGNFCMSGSGTNCVARTCAGKTDATADQAACTAWMTTCRFTGKTDATGGCQDATSNCVYALTLTSSTAAVVCLTLKDSTGNSCMGGTEPNCVARTCAGKTDATVDQAACTAWMTTCRFTGKTTAGAGCQDATSNCVYALTLTSSTAAVVCQTLKDSTGNSCMGGTEPNCVARTCAGKTDATADQAACTAWMTTCQFTGKTTAGAGCQDATSNCVYALTLTTSTAAVVCQTLKDSTGNFCMGGTEPNCVARTCSGKTDATTNIICNAWKSDCQWTGLTSGVTCAVPDTCNNCEARTCSNIPTTPTTNQNCTDWLSTCRFIGAYCIPSAACTAYTVSGTDAANRILCEGITNSSGVLCAFVNTASTCSERTCPLVSTVAQSNCIAWMGTSCQWDGVACVLGVACASYPVAAGTDDSKKTYCIGLKNVAGTPLACGWSSGLICAERDCTNIFPAPATDSDCKAFLGTCRLTNTATISCIAQTSACSVYTGTAAQCKTFKGVNDTIPCWSTATDGSAVAACIDKQCTHNATATTNAECEAFLTTCKTNGSGCVAGSTPCSTFQGNTATCALRLSVISTDTCIVGPSVSDACTIKSCYDDGNSTTDAQCQSFMSTCLTRGLGCVLKTEPCSIYQGNQATCGAFTGNLKKCWNTASATSTSFCVDKKCSDDETSTTDTACGSSLTGCVTKGTGCIEDSAVCGAYSGTQAICSAFKGNKTTLCWNLATALITTPCIEKACIHNTSATSDTECETFLPRASSATIPKCVTSGTGCVEYPRACSGFTGTLEQCGKFTATDGPCKTTATGSILASGTCTPRICTEALNSNNTDALCEAYYKGCVTNGYGCVASVGCSTVQEMSSCSAKVGCSWVNNCRSIGAECSSLTSYGASICKNTPVSTGSRKCSWYNSNTCRAQTCDDLPATLVSHDSCKAIINTCTTTGTGCITMTTCNSYATEVICKAAKTTNSGETCIWDTNACRAKKCTDAPTGTTTNAGCEAYLTGCKTNGTSCMASVLCSTLVTASACQVDGNNNPCLFVNSLCYSYAKCEDAIMTTHATCQQFSSLCTTNGAKCIAISTCAKTVNQISCVVGTDGACGWLPLNGANAAKCQKFGTCSDAIATDTASCAAYGTNCITDGTKCIEKSTCSTYLTSAACDFGGTDGVCQFTSSSSCRLRECTDATVSNASGGITSHSGCYGFTAKNKCTTNGTSCIAFQACASYTVEAGCVEGTDGICVYALPVGMTTGTIACRVKACGDFALTTSATCSVALTGAGLGSGCVSNGTICIVKALCSSYISKEGCNGNGTDGLCAFTPGSTTTPTVGTCKLMTACTDANNDSSACANKPAACKWLVSTSGSTTTTTCNAQTCATNASGSTCNPVPSFDLTTYTVCGPSTAGCTEVAGNTLLSATCQSYTKKTFSWDETNSKCTACFTSNTDPGNGGGDVVTPTTTDGNIIKSLATLVILAILVA